LTGTIYDKAISSTTEYAIFFDNVRVDQFVTNWSAQSAVDGLIGSASLEMIYLPYLYRKHGKVSNIKVGDVKIEDSSEVGDGIDDMTNLRIFVKNQFSGKYCCVFDGNIRSKSLSRTGDGLRITFSASDYITWFNKTIVPLAIPEEDKLTFPDRLRWKAQGINIDKLPLVNQWRELHFRGKNIEQVWKEITDRTMEANMLYSQSEVAVFDNPLGRVVHMADIDPKYTKEQSPLDFIVTAEATCMNSIYVMMNDLIKSVLLEFFQDRDGLIRIKAPFWSEPVLKNHVIDPSFIINFSESINWDAEYSRIIANGGLEWYEDNYDIKTKSYITPTAVYRTDGTYSTSATGSAGGGVGNSTPADVNGSVTGTYLDNLYITSGYGMRHLRGVLDDHHGVDFGMKTGDHVYHVGSNGVVVATNDHGSSGMGKHVVIEITSGSFKGCTIYYAHFSAFAVKPGDSVSNMSLIGYAGNTGNSTGPHLHIGVKGTNNKWMNPFIYLSATENPAQKGNYNLSIGDDALLLPTDYEKKYGPSIYNINQPMIKFSTSGATITNRQPAFDVLVSYSKFMLEYLNSAVNIATLQIVAMPWLRIGFNVWVDPIGVDRVYYISSMSYQGNPNGVYMSLGLTMGRTLYSFLNDKDPISSLNPGKPSNIFINQMQNGYRVSDGDFGEIVGKKSADYSKIKNIMFKFHMNVDTYGADYIDAAHSKYYKNLYGNDFKIKKATASNTEKDDFRYHSVDPSKWTRTLQRGCKGEDVRQLQSLLISLGYDVGEHGADSHFGPDTMKAVIQFQKSKKGLTPDGKVGPKTRAALSGKVVSSTSSLSECTCILRRGSKGKYVIELQKILSLGNYYKGEIDGKFGPATESAVIDFQRAYSIRPDGIVGFETKKQLLSR
jgi:murein DD-endopeptidase MepM/ murein hydrolase activator NlpD